MLVATGLKNNEANKQSKQSTNPWRASVAAIDFRLSVLQRKSISLQACTDPLPWHLPVPRVRLAAPPPRCLLCLATALPICPSTPLPRCALPLCPANSPRCRRTQRPLSLCLSLPRCCALPRCRSAALPLCRTAALLLSTSLPLCPAASPPRRRAVLCPSASLYLAAARGRVAARQNGSEAERQRDGDSTGDSVERGSTTPRQSSSEAVRQRGRAAAATRQVERDRETRALRAAPGRGGGRAEWQSAARLRVGGAYGGQLSACFVHAGTMRYCSIIIWDVDHDKGSFTAHVDACSRDLRQSAALGVMASLVRPQLIVTDCLLKYRMYCASSCVRCLHNRLSCDALPCTQTNDCVVL